MTNSKSFVHFASTVAAIVIAILGFSSCVKVNEELGNSYLATNLQYDVYNASFTIDDMVMDFPDSLSSYSLYRFTVGAIRDETFGLTTRSAAFTLVPVLDTLDFGTEGTQEFHSFHFAAVFDSVSCATADQAFIIQNINVYELLDSIQYEQVYPELSIGTTRITDGIPVYNGSDTLSFNFSQEFGEKYMTVTQEELDTLPEYYKRFPGIYISMDEPTGYGGRINMFKVPIDVQYNSSYYYSSVEGSTAVLSFSAEYDDRGVVDTSFLYYLGPLEKYSFDDVTYTSVSDYPQVAYNLATHESDDLVGSVGDLMYLEGGRGVKPVVKAASLREKIIAEIEDKGGDPELAIISKATITMPFDFPDDYTVVDYQFPAYMSPTCRIVTDTSVTFASITDVSVDDEDQGDINRSLCLYSPDITHHAQQLILMDEDEEDISNYDIWFLPLADEEVEDSSTSSSSTSDLSDYYQYLMYSSYYNSMYGGYSSGSDYYSNYYNYYLYYSLYSSLSTSTTSTEATLDFHRYYCLPLHGTSHEDGPTLTITYAIPKED